MTDGRRENYKRQTDEAHRAIGRYVVAFSELVYDMRSCIALRLTRPSDPPFFAELAIGEATAQPIADSFFAMCGALSEYEPEDEKIAGVLQKQVNTEIKRRTGTGESVWAHPALKARPIRD